MTTFNAILYAVVHGFSLFLPISASAHEFLLPFFFGLPESTAALQSALSMGALLALLVFFRDDWFSILSSFLQVIVFRKKPMTLDERMPFFVFAATVPIAAVWYSVARDMDFEPTPLFIAAMLFAFAALLWGTDRFGRKSKKMFDWNWIDSTILGILQVLSLVPGAGRQTVALSAGLFRNYSREAAAKFVFYSLLPLVIGELVYNLRDVSFSAPAPAEGMTWLTYGVAAVVTFFSGLLAIGGFMKTIRARGLGGFVTYRLVLAGGIVAVVLIRNWF